MEVGKSAEQIGSKVYRSETDKDETKLAAEAVSFFGWKSKWFGKNMEKLKVKVVEL